MTTETAPTRPSSSVPRVLGALAVFAVAAVVTQLPLALSGAAGGRGGWVAAFLFLTPAALLAAWVLRTRVGLGRACGVFLPLALALGVLVAHGAPLDPDGVAAVATEVGAPSGWTSDGTTTGGNAVCVDVCSYADTTWTGGGPDPDARLATAAAHLEDAGFRPDPSGTTTGSASLRRGDVVAELSASASDPGVFVQFAWDEA